MRRLEPDQRNFARKLRENSTDAERALWRGLRGGQLQNARFRRQHPLGPYFLDFACLAEKLVVEVDGGQHAECATDGVRDQWLVGRGWRVLRFWNNEILGNIEGVLTVIAEAIVRPPPQPSPCPGEGETLAAAVIPSPGQGDESRLAPALRAGASQVSLRRMQAAKLTG